MTAFVFATDFGAFFAYNIIMIDRKIKQEKAKKSLISNNFWL